jgi:hypothetical protein
MAKKVLTERVKVGYCRHATCPANQDGACSMGEHSAKQCSEWKTEYEERVIKPAPCPKCGKERCKCSHLFI